MSRPALAADRALEVIDLLTCHPSERFTLTEIVRRTDVNPASLHALLAVLERRGYVLRHPVHRTYGLGPALVAAGSVALEQQPGIRAAAAELDALSEALKLEVLLTAPVGADILVVGRAGHDSAFGEDVRVGRRLPLVPPFGGVFLAWADEEDVAAWLRRARPPLDAAETAASLRSLDAIRERGFAVALESPARQAFGSAVVAHAADGPTAGADLDRLLAVLSQSPYQLDRLDEGRAYDVSMVAAPVFDAHGRAVAAITANGFPPAVDAGEVRRVADEVRGLATIITKRTHGRVPDEGGTRP